MIPESRSSPGEGIGYPPHYSWGSLVAHMVKNLSVKQEMQAQSLGWEDPLEEGMATHSSILAWRIPWTEEPGRLPSMGSQRVRHNLATKQQPCSVELLSLSVHKAWQTLPGHRRLQPTLPSVN